MKAYGGVDFKISAHAFGIYACHTATSSSIQISTLVSISQDSALGGHRIGKKVKLSL
jgi:hypothetical protein